MRRCPKCEAIVAPDAIECPLCGVVLSRYVRRSEAPPRRAAASEASDVIPSRSDVVDAEDEVSDGRLGSEQLKIIAGGLVAAVVVYAVPITRWMFSAIITLFHEFGHAVAGWLLGIPSLPAFDFVYGGGFTHQSGFRPSVAIAVGASFVWLGWRFRENRKSVALIVVVFLVWLMLVTAEWRRELVIAAAGHSFEFILAAVFFYKALAGVGLRRPELERPLAAFVAFFVQLHSMLFALRLVRDPSYLAWYREGKGGALMNDLEVVALDLHIYLGAAPGIEGVARLLIAFSFVPMIVAIGWYLWRARWHRLMRSLRTAEA